MGSDSELVQGGASHTLTMAAVTKRFSDTISCFCFNGDKSKLALCPNTDEIWIYAKKGNEWEEECVLREHSQVVTGLDWGAKTNRIVSCSQDRNAYVWTFENGKWKPTLVILRLQRAATYVSWSPKEDKFAVASGAKLVCICYFEDDNNWWVSKHIKKHRSTVLSVQWHPNNVLVATASSDGHARVFSAWTKGVDKRGVVSPIPDPEKKAEHFGECLLEYECGGFVKDVSWSPSGNLLAFAAQDSTISVADVAQGQTDPAVHKLTTLPLARCLFTSEAEVVAGGFDCEPYVFQVSSGSIKLGKALDEKKEQASKGTSNLKMWQNMDKKGKATTEERLKTKHQNAIVDIAVVGDNKVVTAGLDGSLVWW